MEALKVKEDQTQIHKECRAVGGGGGGGGVAWVTACFPLVCCPWQPYIPLLSPFVFVFTLFSSLKALLYSSLIPVSTSLFSSPLPRLSHPSFNWVLLLLSNVLFFIFLSFFISSSVFCLLSSSERLWGWHSDDRHAAGAHAAVCHFPQGASHLKFLQQRRARASRLVRQRGQSHTHTLINRRTHGCNTDLIFCVTPKSMTNYPHKQTHFVTSGKCPENRFSWKKSWTCSQIIDLWIRSPNLRSSPEASHVFISPNITAALTNRRSSSSTNKWRTERETSGLLSGGRTRSFHSTGAISVFTDMKQ